MADYFVRSLATGAGTGLNWTDAYTTLAAAFTARLAGDRFWIADDHNESQATSNTITSKGVQGNPSIVICVDHNVASPGPNDVRSDPYTITNPACARITTTGASGITIAGFAYYYGVVFSAGTGNVSNIVQINGASVLENCSIRKMGTSPTSAAFQGMNDRPTLINTPLYFGSTGDGISCNTGLEWYRTAPGFISAVGQGPFRIFGAPGYIFGVDLSAIPNYLITGPITGVFVIFEQCTLAASVTAVCNAAPGSRNVGMYMIDCDSANTNYRIQQMHVAATFRHDAFVTRTGGMSNDLGVLLSWAIISNANNRWYAPYTSPVFAVNNTTTNPVTITVYGIANADAIPNNDDIWLNAWYHGAAGSPLAIYKTSNKANPIATVAPLAADSSAWDTQATTRPNSTAVAVGGVYKVASNPGRVFFVITAGTTAASIPAGYASAVDFGSVTDGTAVLRAGYRFALSVVLTSPNPTTEAPIKLTVGVGRPSCSYYFDPLPVVS